MPRHPHVLIAQSGRMLPYTRPSSGGGEFRFPPRDRCTHADKLLDDIDQARRAAQAVASESGHVVEDLCLEIEGKEDYLLKVESLEDLRSHIELRSVRRDGNRLYATVCIRDGKLRNFVSKIERYKSENTTPRTAASASRPKNEDLVAVIEGIRFPVLRSFWTDDAELFPTTEDEEIWWEVWVRIAPGESPDAAFSSFVAVIGNADFHFSRNVIRFPERIVFLVHGSRQQWIGVFLPVLDRLAELRRAKEPPTDFLNLSPTEQREFVEDLASRIQSPPDGAPAVCILDYGVHASHPLIRPFVRDADIQAISPEWGGADEQERHGTEMAGLAIFGDDLGEHLYGNERFNASHRIESVRIFRRGHQHPPEQWGALTQQAVAFAEQRAPTRSRVTCLAATANDLGRDQGRPSSWSAAIDEHASGYLDDVRRLYVISAGNIGGVLENGYTYFDTNTSTGRIEDPGQSWNAVTVGAFTNKVRIQSPQFSGNVPVARQGGLCPTSRTSCGWEYQEWPLKPDIVMEGGNYMRSSTGQIDGCDDLSLLTTTMDPTGRTLTWMSDTSAATAQAARYAAMLAADYPQLWPESIRGLLVHSADWTPEMIRQIPGDNQDDIRRRLRCFGYGVPNLDRARYTVENHVSLVHQGQIQPYRLDGARVRTNQFALHSLPWPREVLAQLHEQLVTVRATLSYFVEPSPAGRGWGKKFRYASHGLRFALRGPAESESSFRQRISTEEWAEDEGRPSTADPIDWEIGSRLRARGSIHRDSWTAPGADVAECGHFAVFPVTGWWRERKHLGFVGKRTRYSLIVTISTPAAEVDLLTSILEEIRAGTEITT